MRVSQLPDEFKDYFNKFGRVTDCVIMKDKDTQKPRGFGFVSFETEEDVDEVLAHYKTHQMKGKWIDCKKATPKTSSNQQYPKQFADPA
jgi:RNA-binding protein Musashi